MILSYTTYSRTRWPFPFQHRKHPTYVASIFWWHFVGVFFFKKTMKTIQYLGWKCSPVFGVSLSEGLERMCKSPRDCKQYVYRAATSRDSPLGKVRDHNYHHSSTLGIPWTSLHQTSPCIPLVYVPYPSRNCIWKIFEIYYSCSLWWWNRVLLKYKAQCNMVYFIMA